MNDAVGRLSSNEAHLGSLLCFDSCWSEKRERLLVCARGINCLSPVRASDVQIAGMPTGVLPLRVSGGLKVTT